MTVSRLNAIQQAIIKLWGKSGPVRTTPANLPNPMRTGQNGRFTVTCDGNNNRIYVLPGHVCFIPLAGGDSGGSGSDSALKPFEPTLDDTPLSDSPYWVISGGQGGEWQVVCVFDQEKARMEFKRKDSGDLNLDPDERAIVIATMDFSDAEEGLKIKQLWHSDILWTDYDSSSSSDSSSGSGSSNSGGSSEHSSGSGSSHSSAGEGSGGSSGSSAGSGGSSAGSSGGSSGGGGSEGPELPSQVKVSYFTGGDPLVYNPTPDWSGVVDNIGGDYPGILDGDVYTLVFDEMAEPPCWKMVLTSDHTDGGYDKLTPFDVIFGIYPNTGTAVDYFIVEEVTDSSASEGSGGGGDGGSSGGSAGSGGSTGSGGGGGGGGGSSGVGDGSGKDTAIVPAPWMPSGYAALFVLEAPEVRFDDVLAVRLTGRTTEVAIDPRYRFVCEPGSIRCCGWSGDKPGSVGVSKIGRAHV